MRAKDKKVQGKKQKTQGILEYTIMFGAVIAIMVTVMLRQGGIGTHMKETYSSMGTALNRTAINLVDTVSPTE